MSPRALFHPPGNAPGSAPSICGPAPPGVACAISHRLPLMSPSTLGPGCWYGCAVPAPARFCDEPPEYSAENRYDTPGCGDSSPSGPIMCCDACANGDGPSSFPILLYTSDSTSSSDSSDCW